MELKIPGSPVPQEPASPSPFVFQSEEPAPSLPIIEPFNMASPDYPIPNSYQRDPQRDYQLRDLAPYLFSGLAICLLIIFVTQSPAIRDHLRDSAERRKQGQDEIDRKEKARQQEIDEIARGIDELDKNISGRGSRRPGEIVRFSSEGIGFDNYLSLLEFVKFLRADDSIGIRNKVNNAHRIGGKSARIIQRHTGVGAEALYEVRLTDSEIIVHTIGFFIEGGK
ncbi:MAG: hypothetical protein JNK93_18580 [Planctomycetia bacterium]|nr:hypothetical protein [Planctomycetia bacterium]